MDAIKKYQIKEFQMRNIPFDENMSFQEAKDLLEQIEKKEKLEKKKVRVTVDKTVWREEIGFISDDGPNRSIMKEDGVPFAYISYEDKNAKNMPTGAKVQCLVGNPGQHRAVAKDLKLVA